jgi:hypothetical protein
LFQNSSRAAVVYWTIRVARASGVIEQDIDPAQIARSSTNGLFDRFWLSYITQLKYRFATRFDNSTCYLLALGDSTTCHDYASPLPSKHLSARLTDPTRCSHQKSAFVFQSIHLQYLVKFGCAQV